jgi:hypothetical protein
MGQNLAAQTALSPAGGLGYLNTDATGALKVVQSESPVVTVTPVAASSGNVAAAAAVATLPAAAGKTTYVAGLTITGGGATAASLVTAVLSGLLGGSLSFTVAAPAGATLGVTPLSVEFNPPLPASAANTAIVLTLPSLGAGNTNAAVSAWGYQK